MEEINVLIIGVTIRRRKKSESHREAAGEAAHENT
jgi:hypothetical protein